MLGLKPKRNRADFMQAASVANPSISLPAEESLDKDSVLSSGTLKNNFSDTAIKKSYLEALKHLKYPIIAVALIVLGITIFSLWGGEAGPGNSGNRYNFAQLNADLGNATTKSSDDTTLQINVDTLVKNSKNSTNIFLVQNASGESLFRVDGANRQIDVNGLLSVNGNIVSNGTIVLGGGSSLNSEGLRINNILVCDATGCVPRPGTSGTIDLNNIDAGNITSGTLSDSRLSGSVTLQGNIFNGPNQLVKLDGSGQLPPGVVSGSFAQLNANQTFSGDNIFSSASNSFTGNGAGLSSLNASNIASGTLNNSRLSASVTLQGNSFNGVSQLLQLDGSGNLPALNASALTSLNATNISSGTLSDLRLSANVSLLGSSIDSTEITNDSITDSDINSAAGISWSKISKTGSSLADLATRSATDLSSGTLADTRLSSNVALLNANQTFTGDNIFQLASAAFAIQDAATPLGINLFEVTDSTGATVYFNVDASGAFVNGDEICTVAGNCAGVGGQIGGGGTIGTIALFTAGSSIGDSILTESSGTVTAAGNLNVTGQYRVAGSQISSANLSNDANLAKLNANQSFSGNNTFTGTILHQNTANSTAAFQIQNAAGTSNLFVADTTNTRLGIGATPANGLLTVGGNTTAATGGVYFGTDTNLYRVAASTLKTDGNLTVTSNVLAGGVNVETSSGPSNALTAKIIGDTYTKFRILTDGTQWWGPGGGTANDTNLYRSAADTLKTDDNFFIQTSTNSATAFQVQNAVGGNVLTADTSNGQITLGEASTLNGVLIFANSANANTVTIQPAGSQTANYTLQLPALAAGTYSICTDSGNCNGAGATMQTTYNNSTSPQILLTATDGGIVLQDAATTVGNLFTIQNNALNVSYLNVTNAGISVAGTIVSTSDINTSGGAIQTNSTTRIDNTGNLTNIVNLSMSGYVAMAGNTTANRPGSPTAGTLYYDTDTDQLLQYNGTKWVSDRTTATKIVAASNSSQAAKDAADYVADGTGDQAEINSALTVAAGGAVYLMEGTYVANATILIPNNTTLAGAGRGTIIELADIDATDNLIENSDTSTGTGVVIRDLRLDGRSDLNTAGTQNGIYLDGMGGGSSSSARQGAKVSSIWVTRFRSHGVRLNSSNNNTVTAVTAQNNSFGIVVYGSSNNTVTGNLTQGNSSDGIALDLGALNNTVTGNTSQGNTARGISLYAGSSSNTITGNNVQSNSEGIHVATSNNTISGNTLQANTSYGVRLTLSNNIIISNKIHDSGGATANNAIYFEAADFNTISSNDLTDSSCTVTCYAINISNSTSDKNYLEGNRFSGSAANVASINDVGTGTIYVNQQTNSTTSTNSDVTDFRFRGSTNSATAFQVQNSTGGTLLGVDTANTQISLVRSVFSGNLLPSTAATISTASLTTTELTNADNVGQYTSIAIGADGLPVISYYNTTDGDLNITKCGNAACSSGNVTTEITNADDVGEYSSIAIGADGLPVISYYNGTDFQINITKCLDASCSSNSTVEIANANAVGRYSSIAIGADGLPVISYRNVTDGGELNITKCGNAACSSGNVTTEITNADDVGQYTSIAIGADGLPVISYQNFTDRDLNITKCGNAACSSGNVTTEITNADDVGYYTSIAIGADGLPVISYRNATDTDLNVTKCGNAACSSGNVTTEITNADSVGEESSIAIGADGLPVISYHNTTVANFDLNITKCGNAACSSGNVTTEITNADDVGRYSSIAIGADGLPVISYRNATDTDLNVTKCGNAACSGSSSVSSGGISLGSEGVGFQSAYIGSIRTSDAVNPFTVDTNGITRLSIDGSGNSSFKGNLSLQPARDLISGETNFTQTLTNASSTGGTVNGYNQSLTVSNTVSASNTNGLNLTLTESTSLANVDKGINITLAGGNSSAAKYGVYTTADRGVAFYGISQQVGSSQDCVSGTTGSVSAGICAESTVVAGATNRVAGVFGGIRVSTGTNSLTTAGGAGVYGQATPDPAGTGGVASNYYVGVKGQSKPTANADYTSVGVYGDATGGATSNIYGGYFTLQATGAAASAALYASNGTATNNIFTLQDNVTDVVTVANGGAALFKNQTNSATAFQVQTASSESLFSVDSTRGGAVTVLGNNSADLTSWTLNGNNLPDARKNHSAVVANGYMYVIGGQTSGGTWQATVYYGKLNADGTVSSFTTSSNPLPVTRAFHTAVVANGYIYVIGGNDGSNILDTVIYSKINADGSNGPWATSSVTLPATRAYHTSVAANGYLYVIGGSTISLVPQNTVYYSKINADGSINAFNTTNTISARNSSTSVVANGYLYVLGGSDTTPTPTNTVQYAKLNSTGTVGSWNTTNTLVDTREGGDAVVLNGYIYYLGGFGADEEEEVFFAQLNAAGTTGVWNASPTMMLPGARDSVAAVTANGYIYAVGGIDTGGTSHDSVYYASTPRLRVGGGLDLVGLSGENLNEGGSGGTLTAGNTTIVGALNVQDSAYFNNSVAINATLSVAGDTAIKSITNSTSAFQVQNASAATIINIDTSTNNLITNGSFEANTTGWSAKISLSTGMVRQTTYARNGSASASFTTSATAGSGVRYGSFALSSNTMYNFSAQVRTNYGTVAANTIVLGYQNTANQTDTTSDNDCATSPAITTGWTLISCTFTTGTVTGGGVIYLKQTDATSRALFIDSAQLTLYSQLANPSIEQAISGNWIAKNSATVTQDNTQTYIGTNSLKIVTTTASTDGARQSITLTTSTSYTLSFYAKLDGASAALTTMEAGYSSDGSTDGNVCITGQTVVSTGWTKYTCTLVTPASTSGTPFMYIKHASATAHTFYVDSVQLIKGQMNDGYQDGRITLNGIISNSVTLQNANDSTGAFQVQKADGTSLFTIDTSNNMITLGSASSTPVLLVLGIKNTSGDPTCTSGAIYYNSSANQFRGCNNGVWKEVGGRTSYKGYSAVTVDGSVQGTTETTLFSQSIAGGVIGANGTMKVRLYLNTYNNYGADENGTLRIKFGGTTVESRLCYLNQGAVATEYPAFVEFSIRNENATNSQRLTGLWSPGNGQTKTTPLGGTAAIDTTSAQTLEVTWQLSRAVGADVVYYKGYEIEIE